MEYTNNNSVSSEEDCVICGNPIEIDLTKHHPLLKKLIEKNPNKCANCLEKIYTLKAYIDIKKHIPVKAGEYDKISQEFDDETLNYYFSILKKYHLIKSFNNDVFFLKEEDDFYETENYKKYSPFLEKTFIKDKTQDKTDFVDLDLIIQEENEIIQENLTEIDSSENNTNSTQKPIYSIDSEIETNFEKPKTEKVKEEPAVYNVEEKTPKTINPPTVKHVNISNLVHKKDSKKVKNPKTHVESKEDIKENDKKEIKPKEKEVSNKVLPQIKHINISNLYKSKKDSNSKPEIETTPNEKQDEVIDEIKIKTMDSEDIQDEINLEPEIKTFEDKKIESINETKEIIDNGSEIKSDDTKIENEDTKTIDKINDDSKGVPTEETNKSVEVSETKETQEESKPKIPPKKSNGQYSLHKGISYKIGVYKWTADIREKGKLKSLGLFDSEEEAYQARQKYIHKKNPNKKDSEIPPRKSNNRFSLHDRVDYDLNKGKWFAYVHEYGNDKFLGYFNTEKEAYSSQCKYLNIFVPTKQKNGQYSLHNGVSFNKRYCKWTSTIRGRKKNKFLGYFCSELDALKAIEVYEESKGKILNIWTPPEELSDETQSNSTEDKFIKTFSYEPADNEYMQVTLNGQIKDDKELFEVFYKLNSFFIKISTLEVNDIGDFISLRANFKIKSDVLKEFIMMLTDDSWIKI